MPRAETTDAFTWHAANSARKGYVLAAAALAIAAFCTAIGFYAGRLSVPQPSAMRPQPSAAANVGSSQVASPQPSPQSTSSNEKERKTAPPASPAVVLLNPGTASPAPASSSDPPATGEHIQARDEPAKQTPAPAPAPKVAHQSERQHAAPRPSQNYRALRDYVLGR